MLTRSTLCRTPNGRSDKRRAHGADGTSAAEDFAAVRAAFARLSAAWERQAPFVSCPGPGCGSRRDAAGHGQRQSPGAGGLAGRGWAAAASASAWASAYTWGGSPPSKWAAAASASAWASNSAASSPAASSTDSDEYRDEGDADWGRRSGVAAALLRRGSFARLHASPF